MSERGTPPQAGFRDRLVAGMLLALAFAAIVPLAALYLPASTTTRFVTPAWMPNQLARLIELSTDVQVGLLADQNQGAHPDICLVTIKESTLDAVPYLSPIDRGLLARLVRSIDAAGPKAIGLDFIFDRHTEPEKDAGLVATLRQTKAPVVLGIVDERVPLRESQRAWQSQFLASAGRPFGFLNLRTDAQESSGNPIVRYRSKPPADAAVQRSFAEALAHASGRPARDTSLRIAWLRAPLESDEAFTTIEADALFATDADPDGLAGRLIRAQIRGRIVIVAGALEGRDHLRTPLTPLSLEGIPGGVIHAHILAQLLDGRRLDDLPTSVALAACAIIAFLAFLIGWLVRGGRIAFLAAMGTCLLIVSAGSLIVLYPSRLIIPIAMMLFVLVAGLTLGHTAATWGEWLLRRARR